MSITKVTYNMLAGLPARSIEEFRIPTDVPGIDTNLVQRAFDSGVSLVFTQNYNVDSVSILTIGQHIDFCGYSLIGTRSLASTAAQFVLGIAARQLTLTNVAVNADFKNYGAAIRWYSESAGAPAQFNNVYGMSVSYAKIGLLFGQEIGTSSVDAAQSENTVYGFKTRGIQQPFVGNQSNGFVTLVSPQLDCNPYEWTTQPGYDATTWQTAARSVINYVGALVIVGGEMLKTSSQLGYGVEGTNIVMTSTTIEFACANFLVRGGNLLIRDVQNLYMASDSAPVFELETFAGDTPAIITLDSCVLRRGNNVWSYSGESLIKGTTTLPVTFNFVNCVIENWDVARIASNNAAVVGATKVTNAVAQFVNTKLVNFDGAGAIVLNVVLQNTSSATLSGAAIASAASISVAVSGQILHVSGTAAIATIEVPITSFLGSVTLVPDGAFTLTTVGGNIGKAATAVVGQAMTLHYDGNKWYPSY